MKTSELTNCCPKLPGRITSKELIEVILGESRQSTKLEALNMLSRKRYKDKHLIYQQILENTDERAGVRYAAALQLGRRGDNASQQVLLRSLKTQDDSVLCGVLRSLAFIGDEEALAKMREVRPRLRSRDVARRLDFAITLVSHRLGKLEGQIELPATDQYSVVEEGNSLPVTIDNATGEEIAAHNSDVKGGLLAISCSSTQAFVVECGRVRLMAVFDRSFDKPASVSRLLRGNSIPLLISREGRSGSGYYVTNYFLTHPSEKRNDFDVTVIRSNGELVYAGKGVVRKSGVDFWVKSVREVNVRPLDIEGVYDGDMQTISLTKATSGKKMVRGKGKPLTPRKIAPK